MPRCTRDPYSLKLGFRFCQPPEKNRRLSLIHSFQTFGSERTSTESHSFQTFHTFGFDNFKTVYSRETILSIAKVWIVRTQIILFILSQSLKVRNRKFGFSQALDFIFFIIFILSNIHFLFVQIYCIGIGQVPKVLTYILFCGRLCAFHLPCNRDREKGVIIIDVAVASLRFVVADGFENHVCAFSDLIAYKNAKITKFVFFFKLTICSNFTHTTLHGDY